MNYVSTLFIFRYYAVKNYRYVLSSFYFYSFLFTKKQERKMYSTIDEEVKYSTFYSKYYNSNSKYKLTSMKKLIEP